MSLDDEVSTSAYSFVCSNGSVTIEDKAVLSLSKIIQDQIKNDPTSSEFALSDVDQQIGQFIADYLNHHNGKAPAPIAQPLTGTTSKEICEDAWDADFIDNVFSKGAKSLRELSNSALKLDIRPLYLLCCAKWALLVRGLPVEQAQAIFRG